VKVMMLYAIKESGRDAPDEQYLAHVVDGTTAAPSMRCSRPASGPPDMSMSTAATSTR
jgi:hypothetical protein